MNLLAWITIMWTYHLVQARQREKSGSKPDSRDLLGGKPHTTLEPPGLAWSMSQQSLGSSCWHTGPGDFAILGIYKTMIRNTTQIGMDLAIFTDPMLISLFSVLLMYCSRFLFFYLSSLSALLTLFILLHEKIMYIYIIICINMISRVFFGKYLSKGFLLLLGWWDIMACCCSIYIIIERDTLLFIIFQSVSCT